MADVNETMVQGTKILSGGTVEFDTPREVNIKSLKVYFSPKQSGEGTPSPENVRPIEGWTKAQIAHWGKNMCWSSLQYINQRIGIAEVLPNNDVKIHDGIATVGYRVPMESGQSATFSLRLNYIPKNSQVIQIIYKLNENNNTVDNMGYSFIHSDSGSITYTASEAATYYFTVRARYYEDEAPNGEVILSNWQVEYGTEATAYEPPFYNVYTVDWEDELGTLYGGYVDFVSGEVVETWNGESLHNYVPIYKNINNDVNMFTHNSYISINYLPEEFITNIFKSLNYIPSNNDATQWTSCFTSIGWLRLYVPSSINSATAMQEYLNNNQVFVAYKLANSVTHQLSPQSLTALSHTNHFFTTADRIEIEYEFVNEFNPMESRKNIMKGTPHLESLSGNFLEFGTDIGARLKECKVYFKPIQEGDGVPSPDNIRNITGWDEINVWHDPQERGVRLIPIDFQEQTSNGVTLKYLGDGKYFFDGKSSSGGPYFDINIEPILLETNLSDTYLKYNSSILNMELWNMVVAIRDNNNNNLIIFGSEYKKDYGDNIPLITRYSDDYLNGALAQKVRFALDLYFGDMIITPELVSSSQLKTIRYPINWSSDFGTIYGGYVDLLKGELVQEWEVIDLSTVDWSYTSFSNINRFYKGGYNDYDLGSKQSVKPDIYCNTYEVIPYAQVSGSTVKDCVFSSNNGYLTIRDTRYTDPTEFKSYLASIGAVACAKLKTPIVHSLTLQQISAFQGTNKIWTDSNDSIELSYWKHGDDAFQYVPAEVLTSNDNFIIVTDDGYVIGDEHDYIKY